MIDMKTVLLASLPLLFDPAAGRTETAMPQSERTVNTERRRLSATSKVGDILRHPAFSGHARRILPWDDRPYGEEMSLSEIGGLLPYHSAVDTGTVLGGLNRMLDDLAAGRQVLYDIYSEADKRADPSKKTRVFSSSAAALENPSRSSPPAEASLMSVPSTRGSLMRSRSTDRATMSSS